MRRDRRDRGRGRGRRLDIRRREARRGRGRPGCAWRRGSSRRCRSRCRDRAFASGRARRTGATRCRRARPCGRVRHRRARSTRRPAATRSWRIPAPSITAHLSAGGETFDARFTGDIRAAGRATRTTSRSRCTAEVSVDGRVGRHRDRRAQRKHARESTCRRRSSRGSRSRSTRRRAIRTTGPADLGSARTARAADGQDPRGRDHRHARRSLTRPRSRGSASPATSCSSRPTSRSSIKETALAPDAGDFDGDRIPIHVSLVLRHTSDCSLLAQETAHEIPPARRSRCSRPRARVQEARRRTARRRDRLRRDRPCRRDRLWPRGRPGSDTATPTTPAPDENADHVTVLAHHKNPEADRSGPHQLREVQGREGRLRSEEDRGRHGDDRARPRELHTPSDERDNHLKSDSYLDVGKFATATIDIDNVKHKDGATYTADAKVTPTARPRPIRSRST